MIDMSKLRKSAKAKLWKSYQDLIKRGIIKGYGSQNDMTEIIFNAEEKYNLTKKEQDFETFYQDVRGFLQEKDFGDI